MSIKNTSIPDNIDAPNGTFFMVGVARYEKPFEGSDHLVVLSQDFCSIDGTFPAYGVVHPEVSEYFLFNISPETHLGGGIKRATCYYAKTTKGYQKEFKQQVQFLGIRSREVQFEEKFKVVTRTSSQVTQVIGGTLFSIPVVKNKTTTNTRKLKAYDIVAREPFGQEVTCVKHIEFVNLAKDQIPSDYLKERTIPTDKNNSEWGNKIEEAYERLKHPDTEGFTPPPVPEGFMTKVATNYLSESSDPSLAWYVGKVGSDDMVVSPSSVEPFYGGELMKIEWVTTEYR